MEKTELKKIFAENIVGVDAKISGWIRSVRKSKKFSFIVLNDGSCQGSLQIIADLDLENYEAVSTMLTGTSVEITGKLVESGGKGQKVEMQALSVKILGESDDTYPLQKKGTSLEFLREQAHIRSRTNLFGAIFRIRHALSMATHEYFNKEGFFYVHTPIVTGVDAEGAGEMFNVTTQDLSKVNKDSKGNVDYTSDYFAGPTYLAVTGQLEAECMALGLGKVYTFGPTFRSENSNTPRHLSEFWMIEPEAAFFELDDVAKLASGYIQYMIDYALKNCKDDMDFLVTRYNSNIDESHIKNLEHVRDTEFVKITYTEAIEILAASNEKFEFPTTWGSELQTEHERFLAEKHYKAPVIVTDYPKEFKAFYMKQNDDGKTVRAMDVLVPGVGEIIGGSQREDNLEKLDKRMDDLGLSKETYWWYRDLRKYGSVPHSGFGLGFERAVMYITGMANIRDVIAFPRTPKNCEF